MPPVIRLRFHAKYWGAWFTPIGKGNVKQTNLNIFYHLGAALEDIQKITPEMTAGDAWIHLMRPHDYTLHFLLETEDLNLPESRAAARRLNAAINQFVDFSKFGNLDAARKLTRDEWYLITQRKEYFENCFDREYRYLDVFTVTPKGIYDTRLLMAKPEEKFPARVRSGLPSQTVADLKQAALCLAFDIPTACVFHVCRATEALMLAYYEVLAGHPWALPRNRDWQAYIDHLVKEGAPKKITDRLNEIRETDRNPYTHPERNVTLEESPIQFELCTGVMFQMADEIDKEL